MINDRRKAEAASLRQLFHEQWSHLLHLLDTWHRRRDSKRSESDELVTAVEQVVSGTNARIRSIGSYKKQLRESVHAVLDYVDTLVDELPEAITVSQETFFSNPLVNAFFVNTEDIRQIFCNARELQDFFANHSNRTLADAYALLFVRKTEKTVLGKDLCGDLLLGDVIQTTVSFWDHQILYPCASELLARKSLKVMLFRSVVKYIRIHMIRACSQQMQANLQHKHLDPIHSLKNPEVYLQELRRLLSSPMELLKKNESTLRVNRMGICLSDNDTSAANELHLNEIAIGDEQTRIVVMVKYPRDEFVPLDNT
jgi:hypothetical protein